MKKKYLLTILIAGLLTACNANVEISQNEDSTGETIEMLDVFSDDTNELIEDYFLEDLTSLTLEEGESLYIGDDLKVNPNIKTAIGNEQIASVSDDKFVTGIRVGKTTLRCTINGYYQDVEINVVAKGSLSDSFILDRRHLYDKNLVFFGDSVTAQDPNFNYPTLLASYYETAYMKNYAIGGTTLTYMYPGSNIDKEYHNNSTAIDGCRVVSNAAIKGELANADYVFVAYGHNDQYFQPPLDSTDSDNPYDINNCVSFKASWRFVINIIKRANPNARIIALNCTYSEYDKTTATPYAQGSKITYADYRNATYEIANEYKLKYLDPWDYMKQYYPSCYKDSVHLQQQGHEKLFEFIINK